MDDDLKNPVTGLVEYREDGVRTHCTENIEGARKLMLEAQEMLGEAAQSALEDGGPVALQGSCSDAASLLGYLSARLGVAVSMDELSGRARFPSVALPYVHPELAEAECAAPPKG